MAGLLPLAIILRRRTTTKRETTHYLGRVARPDGKGSFLVAAGIHPIGTQGAVALLETELSALYATARDRRFSLIVECTFDPAEREVLTAKRVSPIYRHDS